MKSERFSIKNQHGLKLVLQVDTPENPKDLVFIQPGQGGFIEQKHIQAFANAFLENGFRVVRFDPTHSIGESEGDIIDVTYTSYVEDLEDVIDWAKTQTWFQPKFALCGHSMGGFSIAQYAENHPGEILCAAPIAVVINHELHKSTYTPQELADWELKGFIESESKSKPGVIKRVGWGINDDLKKYDLLKNAENLTMPVLLMVGNNDKATPYDQQKILYDAIPSGNKKLVKIKDADHNFRGSNDYDEKLGEVKNVISNWLRDINRLNP